MIMRVRTLFERIFKKAPSVETGRFLSLGLFLALCFAPSQILADANPSDDSAAMRVRMRPKDNFPPKPVTDLGAAISPNEGEILLQWTAPDSNNLPTPSGIPVSKYFIRYATFSVANLGGNTTDRKSTRLNSSHIQKSRMPSSA